VAVNSSRKYDATSRRRQAQQTRAAILGIARDLFIRNGYAATTVPTIAKTAGVSVETVYKAVGPKAALVRALWEQGLAGQGATPAERRSDRLSAHVDDAATLIRSWAELMAEVAPLAAPILLLIRAAASADADMAELLAETERQRKERMGRNAQRLSRAAGGRGGLDHHTIADILWTYSAPELYELLVIKSGWSAAKYSAFVAEAMIAALVDQR
jgi:AcrR family transcriptional regulator